MDRISHKLTFIYTLTDVSVENAEEDWQLLLRITGNFSIEVEDKVFYQESSFPVVEFAYHLAKWIDAGRGSFEYNSMESNSQPLISFIEAGDNFVLYSPYQEYEETEVFSFTELKYAARSLINSLTEEINERFKINISRLLGGS